MINNKEWHNLITATPKQRMPYWYVLNQNGTRVYETSSAEQAERFARTHSKGHIVLTIHQSKGDY